MQWRYSGVGAAWGRRGGGVGAALGRRGGGVETECSGLGAKWGLHLNGRSIYLTYFRLVDVLVFVLVYERLIWYSCMYVVVSLFKLQHLFVPLLRIIFSI